MSPWPEATVGAATYHLWFVPPGDAFDRYAAIIRELASELRAPVFAPHVTLLSLEGPEAGHASRTRALAARLRPFTMMLTGLSFTEAYFRCVFATVQPTGAVMAANALAREMFPHVEDDYMPHLSLLYGNYPEERKREIIARLEPQVRGAFDVDAVHLIRADSHDPKDWHDVVAVPLAAEARDTSRHA